jgi:pimeloyl-ACP methyl ester carboxylesterase
VAAQHFPFLPVRFLLRDAWDNVESLKGYTGPVEIFGARDDVIIPIEHAKALAKQVAGAHLIEIPCGHNDWPEAALVMIKR